MNVRYFIDPETNEPHIFKHNIGEDEVADVLEAPDEDRPGRDGSRIALRLTSTGRFIRVIYVRDPIPDGVFVVTAYELTGKPLIAFRRRRRKKGKK